MAAGAPFTLPVEYLDEMGAIASDMGVPSCPVIVMPFRGRLDPERLARATRLLVEAEPILGCRLETTSRGLIWKSRDSLDSVEWFEKATAASHDEAMSETLRFETRMGDRNIVIRLVSLPEHDLVSVTFNHSVADAQGTIECIYELAAIYTALGMDPAHRLPPNQAARDGFEWQQGLSVGDKARTLLRDIGVLRHVTSKLVGMPTTHDFDSWKALPRNVPIAVERRFDVPEVGAIERVARAHGTTRFAVVLAGFARSFVDLVRPVVTGPVDGPVRIMMPVSLRRYAPPPGSRPPIRNLVVFASATFDPARASDFTATLHNASTALEGLKRGAYGAPNPLTAAALKHLSYRTKRGLVEKAIRAAMTRPVPPTLSHAGRVSEEKLRFDGQSPDDVKLFSGCLPMPTLIVMGTEYRGGLTLSTGYQNYDIPPARMRTFLDGIVADLPSV